MSQQPWQVQGPATQHGAGQIKMFDPSQYNQAGPATSQPYDPAAAQPEANSWDWNNSWGGQQQQPLQSHQPYMAQPASTPQQNMDPHAQGNQNQWNNLAWSQQGYQQHQQAWGPTPSYDPNQQTVGQAVMSQPYDPTYQQPQYQQQVNGNVQHSFKNLPLDDEPGTVSSFFGDDDTASEASSHLQQSSASQHSQALTASYGNDSLSLNTGQRVHNAGTDGNQQSPPAMINSSSFGKLPSDPTPFDAIGTNQLSMEDKITKSLREKLPAHSRESSHGGNVQFIVGSDPNSASQSATHSPYIFGNSQNESGQQNQAQKSTTQESSGVNEQPVTNVPKQEPALTQDTHQDIPVYHHPPVSDPHQHPQETIAALPQKFDNTAPTQSNVPQGTPQGVPMMSPQPPPSIGSPRHRALSSASHTSTSSSITGQHQRPPSSTHSHTSAASDVAAHPDTITEGYSAAGDYRTPEDAQPAQGYDPAHPLNIYSTPIEPRQGGAFRPVSRTHDDPSLENVDGAGIGEPHNTSGDKAQLVGPPAQTSYMSQVPNTEAFSPVSSTDGHVVSEPQQPAMDRYSQSSQQQEASWKGIAEMNSPQHVPPPDQTDTQMPYQPAPYNRQVSDNPSLHEDIQPSQHPAPQGYSQTMPVDARPPKQDTSPFQHSHQNMAPQYHTQHSGHEDQHRGPEHYNQQMGAQQHGQQMGAPPQHTGAPAPSQQLGSSPPSQQIGGPPQQMDAPSQQKGAPAPGHQLGPSPPSQQMGAPPQQMGAPPPGQEVGSTPPNQQIGQPPQQMGAPSPGQQIGSSPPNQQMGTPPQQMGAPPPVQQAAVSLPDRQMAAPQTGQQMGAPPHNQQMGAPPSGQHMNAPPQQQQMSAPQDQQIRSVHSDQRMGLPQHNQQMGQAPHSQQMGPPQANQQTGQPMGPPPTSAQFSNQSQPEKPYDASKEQAVAQQRGLSQVQARPPSRLSESIHREHSAIKQIEAYREVNSKSPAASLWAGSGSLSLPKASLQPLPQEVPTSTVPVQNVQPQPVQPHQPVQPVMVQSGPNQGLMGQQPVLHPAAHQLPGTSVPQQQSRPDSFAVNDGQIDVSAMERSAQELPPNPVQQPTGAFSPAHPVTAQPGTGHAQPRGMAPQPQANTGPPPPQGGPGQFHGQPQATMGPPPPVAPAPQSNEQQRIKSKPQQPLTNERQAPPQSQSQNIQGGQTSMGPPPPPGPADGGRYPQTGHAQPVTSQPPGGMRNQQQQSHDSRGFQGNQGGPPPVPHQGYERSPSRQQSYDRPPSRQQSYDRPSSRQSVHDRPPSRQHERPHSRQNYDENTQNDPRYPDNRPSSRQGYDRQSSVQSDQSGRSQYGYDDRRRGDPRYQDPRYNDPYYRGYDRPHSRSGYDYDPYRDPYQRPSSRGYYQDAYGRHPGEQYERPRSRQEERPHSRSSSRPSSRQGQEPERPRSRAGQEAGYDQKDYYRRDRYRDDYYYRDHQGYYRDYRYEDDPYYSYYYQDRYSRGYMDEMKSYNQQDNRTYDQYGYGQSANGEYDRQSYHSQSRGSTPSVDTGADQFAREFHHGSRPSSRTSVHEQSPIYPSHHDPRYDPRYHYDPRYGYDYSYDGYGQPQPEPEEPGRRTPQKFTIAHVVAAIGPAGQVIKVLPNRPADGQPALVEIQDISRTLFDQREAEELKMFPGPLIKGETHKNDVLLFCQKKIQNCRDCPRLVDRDSAILLWRFLELLIKQNGTIVGTDIADLLLEGLEVTTVEYSRTGMRISNSPALMDDTGATDMGQVTLDHSAVNKVTSLTTEELTDRFRHLLLYGRKKDALEWAIKHNLWGHGLFLASKMDAKTHASVMTRFANLSMRMNDPLQTVYQLMSSRQPAAVTLAADEKWGGWRPHLAMILSNQTNKEEVACKSIVTLGDTLAGKGYLYASHFCYLMAQQPLGSYNNKTAKMVLIGSRHSLPLEEFASNEAIQCTEVYEYAMSLGNPLFVLHNFQVFKYLYATRLAENGMAEEALQYCEVLGNTLRQLPTQYPLQLVNQVYKLGSQLKHHDPQRLQMGELQDPFWLQDLGKLCQDYASGMIQYMPRATPMGFGSSSASSELGDLTGQHYVSQGMDASQQYQQYPGYTYIEGQGYVYTGQTDGSQQWDSSQWVQAADGSYIPYTQQGQEAQASTQAQQDVPDGQAQPHSDSQPANDQPQEQPPGGWANNQQQSGTQSQNTEQTPVTSEQDINLAASLNSDFSGGTGESGDTLGNSGNETNFDYFGLTQKQPASGPSVPLGGGQKMPADGTSSIPQDKEEEKKSPKKQAAKSGGGGGWFGSFFDKLRPKGKNEMILPDDKNPAIVWDPDKKRWVNTDGDEEDESKSAAPPPKDSELDASPIPTKSEVDAMLSMTGPATGRPPMSNKFSRQKSRGARGQYVDVFNQGKQSSSSAVPSNLFDVLPKSMSVPANMFLPGEPADDNTGDDQTDASSSGDNTAPPQQPPQQQSQPQGVQMFNPASVNSTQSNSTLAAPKDTPDNLSRCSSQSSLSREVQQITMQAPAETKPVSAVPPPAAAKDGAPPPGMPMMFNPSQFSHGSAGGTTSHSGPGRGPRYGQRRAYPR